MAERSWGLSAAVPAVWQRGQGGCCHPSARLTEQNHQGASTEGFATLPRLPPASLFSAASYWGFRCRLWGFPG